VTGSGTGAGGGSVGLGGGLLKAWSGSFFGQPQLNNAAIIEIERIQYLGRTLDPRLDADQGRSEAKDQFMFLIYVPSFYRNNME
jgi:hypothetical protein